MLHVHIMKKKNEIHLRVSRTIKRVIDAMIPHMAEYVHAPTHVQARQSMTAFQGIAGFPGIFGCIDCTHINIQAPHVDEDVYVNRKNKHSINVQLVCDHNMVFIHVDAQSPGSFHDSRVLKASTLYPAMECLHPKVPGVLLGDSGYPLKKWLMTPFRNPQTPQQENFNNIHRRTRQIVERCIGVLKRRFACLYKGMALKPEKVCLIVYCCVMLYNRSRRLRYPLECDDVEENFIVPDFIDTINNLNVGIERESERAGQIIRNRLVEILGNNVEN